MTTTTRIITPHLSLVHLLLFSPIILYLLVPAVTATKHTFHTKHDSRLFIGPIGSPFGFLTDGVYSIQVHDFQLEFKSDTSSSSSTSSTSNNNNNSNKIKAGLTLHRFSNEAAFGKLEEELFELESNLDEYSGSVTQPIPYHECPWAVDNHDNRHRNDVIDLELQQHQQQDNITDANQARKVIISADQQGLYFLYYSVCTTQDTDASKTGTAIKYNGIRSSFALDLDMYNVDGGGNASYLTAGDMPLPKMYLMYGIVYAACVYVWLFRVLLFRRQRGGNVSVSSVKQIHHLMSIVCILKAVTLFSESARYHYIRISGSSEVWTTIYYCFEFLKGTMLFTVILLLGSGWSFLKPFLNQREKKLVFAILLFQVLNNIAILVVSHHMQGELLYNKWTSILHLVDILCCAAVLVPIVWQVATLEEETGVTNNGDDTSNVDDNEDATTTAAISGSPSEEISSSDPTTQRAVAKLKLFRSFYITVVAYIYFTRIIVYLFASVLDYHQTWIRHFVVEFGTLVFYVYTGYTFRPMDDRTSYVELQQRDKDDYVHVEEGEFVAGRVDEKKGKKIVAEI